LYYKIGKKIFSVLVDLLGLTQISLVFLAFATILYWILTIVGVAFVKGLDPFFNSVLDFVHQFYNRPVQVENVTLDFSFLIFALLLLSIVWALKPTIEFIQDLEVKYDKMYKDFKKQAETLFNINLERAYVGMENKNKKFLVLIKFTAEEADIEMSYNAKGEDEINAAQHEALTEFAKGYSSKDNVQKKFVESSLLLYFNDFEKIDPVISELRNTTAHLKHKFSKNKWILKANIAIEIYADDTQIMDKYKKLRIMLKINNKNEMLCLGTFKQRYLLVKNPQHLLECKGVYHIDGNEDVFVIKPKP